MSVRAKFKLDTIVEPIAPGMGRIFYFNAVTDGSEENKSFARYTPAGQFTMTVDEDTPAASYFQVGKSYYLDFNETPE